LLKYLSFFLKKGYSAVELSEAYRYCSNSPSDTCCDSLSANPSADGKQNSLPIIIGLTTALGFLIVLGLGGFAFIKYRGSMYRKSLMGYDDDLDHEDKRGSRSPLCKHQYGQEEGLRKHIAIHPYVAVLHDEISLQRGDILTIKEIFNDGWVRGTNETLGRDGTFPSACIGPLNSY